jgi:DNA-binding CsgD family transcriptional regulator
MERVPSSPYVIRLSGAEYAELESLSRRATAPIRAVLRARIVLLAAGGAANSEIARRLGTCEDTARKWRRRYCEKGLEGLLTPRAPAGPGCSPPRS